MDIEEIKTALRQRGISQRKLALGIGLDPSKLNRTLNGNRKLYSNEERAIASYLAVTGGTDTGTGPSIQGLAESTITAIDRTLAIREEITSSDMMREALIALLSEMKANHLNDLKSLSGATDDRDLVNIAVDAACTAFKAETPAEASTAIKLMVEHGVDKFIRSRGG